MGYPDYIPALRDIRASGGWLWEGSADRFQDIPGQERGRAGEGQDPSGLQGRLRGDPCVQYSHDSAQNPQHRPAYGDAERRGELSYRYRPLLYEGAGRWGFPGRYQAENQSYPGGRPDYEPGISGGMPVPEEVV